MGKLVPQDPNDEPASILLEKINTEKEQLIKDKRIKKPKKTLIITEDDLPFKIPNGWLNVRLQDLIQVITKGSSPKWQGVSYTEDPKDVLFVTSENVGSFHLIFNNKKYVEKTFNDLEPKSILKHWGLLNEYCGGIYRENCYV